MSKRMPLILSLFICVLLLVSQATATTSLTYQYDANGNLIQGDGKYYEYNDANQLVRVKYGDANGPVLAEYFYDYTGQRIKKIENGVTTYYIGKHYEKQLDSAGSATNTSYYFANGERVAKKDPSGNLYYYHLDHLGGTNVVTDSSGNLIERIKYFPFGEIREGGNEKYSFTGKEKDRLTDYYYFEARYYNSDFEHFTQADTIEPDYYDPQSLNMYSYVGNNPLSYVDSDGHKKHQYKPSKREKRCIKSGTDPDKHHNKYRNLSKHEARKLNKDSESKKSSKQVALKPAEKKPDSNSKGLVLGVSKEIDFKTANPDLCFNSCISRETNLKIAKYTVKAVKYASPLAYATLIDDVSFSILKGSGLVEWEDVPPDLDLFLEMIPSSRYIKMFGAPHVGEESSGGW